MIRLFLTVLGLTTYFHIAHSQCNAQFSIGNDTVINCNSSIVLSAPAGFDSYSWSNNSNNQSINVGQAGIYSCTATQYLSNAVVNGDFSNGSVGFQSDYIPGTGGTWGLLSNEGEYTVTSNSSLAHNNFVNCFDHTVGNATGSMLVVNGSSTGGLSIWEQTIPVQPNTNYSFSAWGMSTVSSNPAQLSFSVNGTLIGTTFNLSSTTCNWQQFSASWNSGTNTTAVIALVNQNTSPSGNDFAIDDITFSDVCSYSDTIQISYPPNPVLSISSVDSICEGDTISLIASTDIAGTTVTWFPGLHTGDTLTISPSSSTFYTAMARSPQNCNSNTVTASISVFPNPEIDAFGDTTICSGDSARLYFTSSLPLDSIYWLTTNSSDSLIWVQPIDSTSYIITGRTEAGCMASDTVTVLTNPIPTATLTPTQELCEGESTFVNVQYNQNHPTKIYWNNNLLNQDSLFISPLTDTAISAYITQYGCKSAIETTQIIINPNPTISTIDQLEICYGEDYTIEAKTPNSNAEITWFPIYLNGYTYASTAEKNELIKAVAKDGNCLSDTAFTEVIIDSGCDCIWQLANVFSPNGDGKNDVFFFEDENESCLLRNYKLTIYNRWGDLVFEAADLNAHWDGKNKGNQVVEGTYYWTLQFTDQSNKNVDTTGTVTLLK